MSRSSTRGSSTTALILRKKVTASLPSTSRWSYVRAKYIMGRTSTCQSRKPFHCFLTMKCIRFRKMSFDATLAPGLAQNNYILEQRIVEDTSSVSILQISFMAYLSIDGHRSVKNAVHTQDGRLWGVDDGCSKHRAEHAAVTDGEGASVHIFNSNLVFTSLRHKIQSIFSFLHFINEIERPGVVLNVKL